jgi:hypothetical protein
VGGKCRGDDDDGSDERHAYDLEMRRGVRAPQRVVHGILLGTDVPNGD